MTCQLFSLVGAGHPNLFGKRKFGIAVISEAVVFWSELS